MSDPKTEHEKKLGNAPTGLDQGQVDARVAAGVADWADLGCTRPTPGSSSKGDDDERS